MHALLSLAILFLPSLQTPTGPAVYEVPLAELELVAGAVMPRYAGHPPWQWSSDEAEMPRAVLDGNGACVFLVPDEEAAWSDGAREPEGTLVIRTDAPRDLTGTLFVPKASGGGFLKLGFRVPAARGTAGEEVFLAAELRRNNRLLGSGVPGGAWFRHRRDELRARLDSRATPPVDPAVFREPFRDSADALELFSGSRAVYENLQLDRGLPGSSGGEPTVPLDTLEGITVRAFDWASRLEGGETPLDPLARLVPADQHALFFRRFQGLVEVLDEAERLGAFGLTAWEARSTDAETRLAYERQLCLALDEVARLFGPLAIESVALTGSDPYLRSGSDVALLLEVKAEFFERVFELIRSRQEAAGFGQEAAADGIGWLTRSPTRSVSSHFFAIPEEQGSTRAESAGKNVLVVSNSVVQSTRILDTAAGRAPALASSDEYRFFRRRYALGAEPESAFLVLSDAAIRRWCSPRWRIAAARRVGAAAALAELHARHLAELVAGTARAVALEPVADFPDLGPLRLGPEGLHSLRYGTLAFQTPIVELALDLVTEREAELYRTWRQGYQAAWSNFFDPIAARLAVSADSTSIDLTVMPLILDTQYAELRAATRGKGLVAGSGDPHPSALVHFAMSIDPQWELLRSIGKSFGPAAEALGADPLGWLGGWLAIYLDDAPLWDEVLEAEDLKEVLNYGERLNEIPLALTIAVSKPLQLALFLTTLRTFVDGTAPGMTEWKERVVGDHRFVQISSPGLGDPIALFYATTPRALVLSLREETLLAAMERIAAGPAAATSAAATSAAAIPGDPGSGDSAALALTGRGFELLETLLGEGLRAEMRRGSFANLPILNEWKRLYPERDPLEVHARAFHEQLRCPGGGHYVWNPEWSTMESSVYGHPGLPKDGPSLPPGWDAFAALRSRLTFEEDGLRVRVELERE